METDHANKEQKGLFYSVIKYFSTQDSEKLSKSNRLTNSYIYGFEDIISHENRIVNAALGSKTDSEESD